jgi:hypothetical protein
VCGGGRGANKLVQVIAFTYHGPQQDSGLLSAWLPDPAFGAQRSNDRFDFSFFFLYYDYDVPLLVSLKFWYIGFQGKKTKMLEDVSKLHARSWVIIIACFSFLFILPGSGEASTELVCHWRPSNSPNTRRQH